MPNNKQRRGRWGKLQWALSDRKDAHKSQDRTQTLARRPRNWQVRRLKRHQRPATGIARERSESPAAKKLPHRAQRAARGLLSCISLVSELVLLSLRASPLSLQWQKVAWFWFPTGQCNSLLAGSCYICTSKVVAGFLHRTNWWFCGWSWHHPCCNGWGASYSRVSVNQVSLHSYWWCTQTHTVNHFMCDVLTCFILGSMFQPVDAFTCTTNV